MSTSEVSIDVDVPVRTAYNQWTQLDSFPRFMDGVRRVERHGAALTQWVTRFGPVEYEFDAEIVEQVPDELLSWRSLGRPLHAGTVVFRPLGERRSLVTLRIDLYPRGPLERFADATGLVRRRMRRELHSFKEYIEGHGRETGRWRGAIRGGHVRPHSGQPRPEVPNWPVG